MGLKSLPGRGGAGPPRRRGGDPAAFQPAAEFAVCGWGCNGRLPVARARDPMLLQQDPEAGDPTSSPPSVSSLLGQFMEEQLVSQLGWGCGQRGSMSKQTSRSTSAAY